MATYNQISYGSSGSTVTELQKLLNQNGYNIAVDGIFGANTQAAVKDYQQKNGLAADGIVGTNTWGALTSSNKPSTPTAPSAPSTGGNKAPSTSRPSTSRPSTSSPAVSSPTFNYGDYKPSDTVAKAEDLLNQHLAQKPGEYQSAWQDQINEILQQILNREKFSYDLNGDALYQQYKDQYTAQGKMAMMDAIGMAQAATGGYGNSYAESVGQQTYQGYLQNLNDKVPELYQLALNKYQMEGDEMRNQAAIMAQQEEQDYGRYRDLVNDWQAQRDYLAGRYDTERDYDYSIWADGRDFAYNQFADDRNYNYQVSRDQVLDAQWQAQFDEAVRQYNQQYALASASSGGSGGSGGGGSGGSGGGGYDSETAALQQQLNAMGANLTVDGIWGPKTQAAYDKYMGGNPDPAVPTNYNEFSKYLSTVASGSTKEAISIDINNALAAGIINQNQAQQLRNLYMPKAKVTIN